MIFILMASSLIQLDQALVQSGYTTEIRLPMPDYERRLAMIREGYAGRGIEPERLAELTAGLTLMNIDTLVRLAMKKPFP